MSGSPPNQDVARTSVELGFASSGTGGSSDDLRTVAAGGALNLLGSVSGALFGFLVVVVVTRGMGRSSAGVLFESIALFALLGAVTQWGAGVGLVRLVPSYLVGERHDDIGTLVVAALVPVGLGSLAIAGLLATFAEPLGRLVTNDIETDQMASVIRVLAWCLPAAALLPVSLAATQGFGTMVPTNVVDKGVRATLQPLLVAAALASGATVVGVGLAWALPFVIALGVALCWLKGLVKRSSPVSRSTSTRQGTRARAVLGELWRFAAPRGLAGLFAVTILWLGTLLLGAFRSPREAAVYAAAGRYLTFGLFIGAALIQVVGPRFSELLARGDRSRVGVVFATSTSWWMLLSWPLYFTMITFAPALLSIFGPGYQGAEPGMIVLGCAMLVATAAGPVDMLLLMAGKSSLNLINTAVSVTANIALNLVLIPRLGLTGAAIAWGVSIVINNVLPLAEVYWILGLHPFSMASATAAGVTSVPFLLFGLAFRQAFGSSLGDLAVCATIATALWASAVWAFRRALNLSDLMDLGRRGGRPPAIRSGPAPGR